MKSRVVIDLVTALFLAVSLQLIGAHVVHVATSAPLTLGEGAGSGNAEPARCTIYCPAYVSTGGVSGKRTGEDGYVATSYGPAGPLNTSYYSAPDYTGQALAEGGTKQCPTTLVSNTTYSWCHWTSLYISGVTGVVIHGCIINGAASPDGSRYTDVAVEKSTVTIEYCELRPPANVHFQTNLGGGNRTTSQFCAHNGGSNLTLSHVDCWGMADGSDMGPAPATTTYTYVWMHDWRDPNVESDHSDAYLDNCYNDACTSGALTVSYSTLSGSCNGSVIANQNGSGHGYKNQHITHSYFSGCGYTINLCGAGAGCVAGSDNAFTDNQIGDDWPATYGVLYGGVYGHFTWRRNTWFNTPGGHDAANRAAHDGKYVFPNGALSGSDFAGT